MHAKCGRGPTVMSKGGGIDSHSLDRLPVINPTYKVNRLLTDDQDNLDTVLCYSHKYHHGVAVESLCMATIVYVSTVEITSSRAYSEQAVSQCVRGPIQAGT